MAIAALGSSVIKHLEEAAAVERMRNESCRKTFEVQEKQWGAFWLSAKGMGGDGICPEVNK